MCSIRIRPIPPRRNWLGAGRSTQSGAEIGLYRFLLQDNELDVPLPKRWPSGEPTCIVTVIAC